MAKPEQVLSIVIGTGEDARTFELYPERLSASIVRKVRAATGQSVRAAMETAAEDPDIDVIATLCYAAALQADPAASFADIEEAVTYDSVESMTEGAESPEA